MLGLGETFAFSFSCSAWNRVAVMVGDGGRDGEGGGVRVEVVVL